MAYDVAVVGGGTAGCVVASRLSEDPTVRVVLIEAGGDERRGSVEDPGRWDENLRSETDWCFRTVPQSTGRSYDAPRGRVLGGSGSINCMTYLRGHRLDFDGWSEGGAKGWAYADVLPYFKRAEHVPEGDTRYRGIGGPLHPRRAERPSRVAARFVHSARRLGHRAVDDFNAAEMEGIGYSESLIRDGRRESTAGAYLRPAMGRANLTVLTDTDVVGLDIHDGRCRGVRVAGTRGRELITAGEVVLAAGAVGSPHLLQVSGVGDPGELHTAGVRVVADLPAVGRHLQDHVLLTGIRYRADRPVDGQGMEGAVLLTRIDDGAHGPDLLLNTMNIDYHMPWQDGPVTHPVTFGIGHMRPRSRGSVRLASGDPQVPPLIDPGYLREPDDLQALIRGVEIVDEIVRDGAFEQWGGASDTSSILAQDAADVEASIKNAVGSYFHLSGSCRMGEGVDTVVDSRLRVHGVRGLRVADASIMPTIVSCNTNAAAVMIGEKAADLIRGAEPRRPSTTERTSS